MLRLTLGTLAAHHRLLDGIALPGAESSHSFGVVEAPTMRVWAMQAPPAGRGPEAPSTPPRRRRRDGMMI